MSPCLSAGFSFCGGENSSPIALDSQFSAAFPVLKALIDRRWLELPFVISIRQSIAYGMKRAILNLIELCRFRPGGNYVGLRHGDLESHVEFKLSKHKQKMD
jgi:hypothetical protein